MQTRLVLLISITLAALLGACSKQREISALDNAEADARVAKARVELQLGSPANAEKLLLEALKLNPDIYAWWVELANVRLQLGKNKDARKACENAVEACSRLVKKDPKNIEPRLSQMRLLVTLGREKDARKALDQAFKELPDDPVIRQAVAQNFISQLVASPDQLKLPE
ncbi:MAG: tetratricopeptide repeat protein [Opitutaceae bacterium]|jgi:predicted Zn-dependent protease|nr:tetratricopeptide repeat protein [Opitutaceae bacterium]